MKTLLLSCLLNRLFFVLLLVVSLSSLVACQPDTVEPKPEQAPEVHINHNPVPLTPVMLPQAPAPLVGAVMPPQ